MRFLSLIVFLLSYQLFSQDFYEQARYHFNEGNLDSARVYINKNLARKPTAADYFLSGMIHEAQNADLRALADYEAVIHKDANNLEAYFQKGLIYYNSASTEQAIDDFTYVISNQKNSSTNAIYFGVDPLGAKGTFLTTLQSMTARVHQYRGMAYQKVGEDQKALDDFNDALSYDSSAEVFINRAMLYSKMNRSSDAINDLKYAIELENDNYLAWYNLAVLDPSTLLPTDLLNDQEFTPMLSLMGANAYESENYAQAVLYYSRALEVDRGDEVALIGRGKALLKTNAYNQARKDFISALQQNSDKVEALYLIGNSFFYEEKFEEAIGFYNQYLSINPSYANVWYNVAMAYLSEKEKTKGCQCLVKANDLGMEAAKVLLTQQCDSQ